MSTRSMIRVASFALLLAATLAISPETARAADARALPPPLPPVGAEPLAFEGGVQSVTLGVGKSVVIDLPRDVKDVLVANPEIANAVVRSTRRAYLIGGKIGQTNIYFFDENGAQLAGFDIAVTRDLNGLRATLRRMFPLYDIAVEGLGANSVVLTGMVANAGEAQQIFDLATRLVDTSEKVVNALTIKGRDQVMIKVTVAEVQRDLIKQLGIDLNGTIGTGNAVVNFNTDNAFSAFGGPLSTSAKQVGTFGNRVTATLRAMERANVIRTLAEPNLSAVSGESATFLAGGEFPIFAGATCTTPTSCVPNVQFKNFGVSLSFTPIVLSEGRISLRVLTEVSELSQEGAVTLQGVTIPALKVRRVNSTVEIPSGGALAMAGLIREETKQAINGFPGLLQIPVLGTLFRSRDYVNNQTELMIMATPYVVRPVAPKELSRPDDGFADMSDPSSILLGRLNRIYGVGSSVDPRRTYFGRYGFILD